MPAFAWLLVIVGGTVLAIIGWRWLRDRSSPPEPPIPFRVSTVAPWEKKGGAVHASTQDDIATASKAPPEAVGAAHPPSAAPDFPFTISGKDALAPVVDGSTPASERSDPPMRAHSAPAADGHQNPAPQDGPIGIRDESRLRHRLREAAEAGEVLTIVYHGGSRPGSIRDVRPLSLTSDSLLATDVAEGIDKTFRLERLEIAPEGSTVTPRVQIPRIRGEALDPGNRAPESFTVEVMRRRYQKDTLARMIDGEPSPGGIVTPARCVPGGEDGGVQVEINGVVIGALYSKYWWHYRMMLGDVATECRALITGPEHDVMLDLVLPPLDPEIAPHAKVDEYLWNVVHESDYQPALRSIVRARSASKPVMWVPLVMARLVREPGEIQAVRVEIAKSPVGYLSRGVASQYCALDSAPHEVPAMILRGGQSWDLLGGMGDYTVMLSLPLPEPRR